MLFSPAIYTVEEVLEIVETTKESIKQGQTVTSWTSLGSSATLYREIKLQTILEEAVKFLQFVDPTTYGNNVKVGRITYESNI